MTDYKLNFIRHGMTGGNLFGLYIGATDLSLCEEGKTALEELRREQDYPSVHKVYTSPLKRCIETADILYPDRWTEVVDGLKECNFGTFEARRIADLKNDPDYIKWMEDASQAPPGGESAKEVSERVQAAVEYILNDMMKLKINRAAVITHGGIIAMLMAAYGLPRRDIREWPVDFGYGWCASVNPQIWRNDKLFEVLDEIPYNYSGEY